VTKEEMLALVQDQRIVKIELEGDSNIPDTLNVYEFTLENGVRLSIMEPVYVMPKES